MFPRYYAGIGVGHHAQYNLPSSNFGCSTQNEPSTAVDEPDLYDGDEDMSETDKGRIEEGQRDKEDTGDDSGDDDDDDDKEEEEEEEEGDDNDNDTDEGGSCSGGAFKF
jgi:hypothetical protein